MTAGREPHAGSPRRRWLWAAALYGAGVLTMGIVSFGLERLLH